MSDEALTLSATQFLVIYLSIETVKFLAAKIISHREQLGIIKEIAQYQVQSAKILEKIVEARCPYLEPNQPNSGKKGVDDERDN